MNTYILIGMGIGLVVTLILIKVLHRREKAPVKNELQNVRSLFGNEEVKFKVREYLAMNKKIEAIKFVREKSGAGLLESKNFVELIEKNKDGIVTTYQKSNSFTEINADIEINRSAESINFGDKIVKLLKEQNKLEAIKLAADTNKLRLADAKKLVEAIEEKLKN